MSVKAVVIPTSLKDKLFVVDIQSYKSFYKHIGCRCFDVVHLGGKDDITVDCFVDDEGKINGSDVNEYFYRAYLLGHIYYPLYGICVICLSDERTGDSCELDLELVVSTLKELGFSDDELNNLNV